ncbi:MAG: hypothetical protein GY810_04675 [Aureispira sp.]|nr:hypothetical protein [Aureispira sp.]
MKPLVYILLIGLIGLNGCKKFERIKGVDIEDWDPDLALAIVNTRASVDDVLNNFETGGFIDIDSTTGAMRLVYEGNLFSVTGKELTNVPDFTIPVVDSFITEQFDFPAGDVIQQADFKNGTLSYSLKSVTSGDIEVKLQFPSATQNGQPLETTVMINSNSTATGSISLANSSFDFANNNDFPVRYIAKEVANGNRVLLGTSSSITFQDLDYSYVQGYIGNYNFTLPLDTIVLDIFKNWKRGQIYFDEPKIEIKIQNSFGIPIRLTVDKFDAYTFKGGVIPLNSTQLTSGIDFSYPSISEVGKTKETIITIDNTSNLPNIIGNVPKEFYYQMSATANPTNTPTSNTFFLDTSKFNVDILVELPLYGWAKDFVVEDVFSLDLSLYEEFDYVDFKLITENGFPAEAKVQLYFEDENGNVLDSLIHKDEPVLLGAAPVDGNGKVTEEKKESIYSQFPIARYANLRDNAKQLRLVAAFETTGGGNQSVRVYPDYALAVKLGARGSLNMDEVLGE